MMSDEEKAAYLASISPEIEQRADAYLLKNHGRTYNGDAEDQRRAARLMPIPRAEKNGHHPDSLARIQSDFPDLFGKADDAA